MATIPLPPEWKEFLRLMTSNEVEFMLIGGIAVGYYGYPRATGDIVLWVNETKKNSVAVWNVLKEFGLEIPVDFEDIFLQPGKMFRFGTQPLRIGLLTTISGVIFNDCYQRCQQIELDGVPIRIISFEDLKRNKQASGRTNDIDDLANLPK